MIWCLKEILSIYVYFPLYSYYTLYRFVNATKWFKIQHVFFFKNRTWYCFVHINFIPADLISIFHWCICMGINHVYINTYMCYIYILHHWNIYIYRYSVLIYFYMFIYMVYIYIYTVTSLEWWFVSELIPKWLHVLAIFNLWMIIIQPSILYIYTHTIYTANAWACPEPRPRQATHHHHHHHHHQTLIEDLQWMY